MIKSLQVLMIIVVFLLSGCKHDSRDYRQDMRNFVHGISAYAKGNTPNFIIIPQNGQELLTENGGLATEYLNSINGLGREDLFYGYNMDNEPTPVSQRNEMIAFLDIALEQWC